MLPIRVDVVADNIPNTAATAIWFENRILKRTTKQLSMHIMYRAVFFVLRILSADNG